MMKHEINGCVGRRVVAGLMPFEVPRFECIAQNLINEARFWRKAGSKSEYGAVAATAIHVATLKTSNRVAIRCCHNVQMKERKHSRKNS